MKLSHICSFLLLLSIVVACKEKSKTKNVVQIEVEESTAKIPFWRLDQELFENNTSFESMLQWHNKSLAAHPNFYSTYIRRIMQLGKPDSYAAKGLFVFASGKDWKELQQNIDTRYKDITPYQSQLELAFAKLKVLFPNKITPEIIYFNSGFNVGVWPDSNLLGIGLEWYLGADNKIVKQLPNEIFPKYKRDNMLPEALVSDAVKGWMMYNFYEESNSKDVLTYILFQGKILYTLGAVLPEVADTLKMSYTKTQLDWAYANEKDIWKEMVKNELIFSTSQKNIYRLTNDGPFTNGFPQEGPPMLGVFMAWQIVADYMEKNPKTTLNDLFYRIPAKQILAAYKPN